MSEVPRATHHFWESLHTWILAPSLFCLLLLHRCLWNVSKFVTIVSGLTKETFVRQTRVTLNCSLMLCCCPDKNFVRGRFYSNPTASRFKLHIVPFTSGVKRQTTWIRAALVQSLQHKKKKKTRILSPLCLELQSPQKYYSCPFWYFLLWKIASFTVLLSHWATFKQQNIGS